MTQRMTAEQYRAMVGIPKHSSGLIVPPVTKAKGRLPQPGRTYKSEDMNKLEAAYSRHLDELVRIGKVAKWKYEAIKFKLAKNTFYSPDFLVVMADGTVEIHETKGHWEDDARVKIKTVAGMYPFFLFVAIKKGKQGWEYEYFGHGATK